eukprot:TRINITY_DN2643_c0_g1_i2.p1 TRINITY_DN2643_c0_g1~~TRINITY_DN2643_c0_g1_i2.p1  ORF type:complete len:282 (+),score=102.92 TRINITY_DN2643_c0_g1_i2:91-846(+)
MMQQQQQQQAISSPMFSAPFAREPEVQDLGFLGMDGLHINPEAQQGMKIMARIGQLAQAIPQGLLVNLLCELVEEFPQIAEPLHQKLEKADNYAQATYSQYAPAAHLGQGVLMGPNMNGMPPGMMHMDGAAARNKLAEMAAAAGMVPDSLQWHLHQQHHQQQVSNWLQQQQQQAVVEKKQQPLARKPRPHANDSEQLLCSKHNALRSKKHLSYNGASGFECIPGFHCLESSPATAEVPQQEPAAAEASVST